MLGLIETVYSYGGSVKISFLADELRMDMDDLGDVIDFCELLGLVEVKEGTITLTLFGEGVSLGTIDNKKKILRKKMITIEPFKSAIEYIKENGNELDEKILFEKLNEKFTIEDIEKFRKLLIGWGNYTETFEYDGEEGVFRTPN